MDPVVERVRELVIEEVDSQEDVDRVIESGPWPALIWKDLLWIPHRLSLYSPLPWDAVRGETVRAHVRSTSPVGRAGQTIAAYDRLVAAEKVYAVQYGLWPWAGEARCDARFAVLVDGASDLALMDRVGLFARRGGRKAASLAPPKQVRRVLEAVAEEIGRRREAREAAEFMRRAGLARWRKERCAELSVRLQSDGLTCPRCRTSSRSHRLVTSFFICGSCGCSFRPEELPGEIPLA